MKNKYLLLVISLLFSIVLVACNSEKPKKEVEEPAASESSTSKEEDTVNTSDDGKTITNETGTYTLIKKVDGNETATSGPFTVTIPQVTVVTAELTDETAASYGSKNFPYIQVDMDISHETENTDTILGSFVKLVTNTGEQLDPDIVMSDIIDGEFYGKVNKSGSYAYVLKNSQPEDIEWVRVIIDSPLDSSHQEIGKPFDIRVNF
ncbi:hypothetical protein [Bacillus badius]|uniref:Lipoprotein n=1 Tax=Bacillus badius TaxID=1455 RepID=A0ABR5AXT4_BACBA|nr:hypothetical protein [Bacillus badius]KIL79542.1 hypothetical protein SD77_1996 [Bacillus badius]MED4718626.1 hypothetical protein [Bacillus badius]